MDCSKIPSGPPQDFFQGLRQECLKRFFRVSPGIHQRFYLHSSGYSSSDSFGVFHVNLQIFFLARIAPGILPLSISGIALEIPPGIGFSHCLTDFFGNSLRN